MSSAPPPWRHAAHARRELSDFVCPITHARFREPVVTCDGHTYERHAIETWLKEHDTSPLTGERLRSKVLLPSGCAIQRRDALERARDAGPLDATRDAGAAPLPDAASADVADDGTLN